MIKEADLAKELKNGVPGGLYFFYGDEDYVKNRRAADMKRAAVGEDPSVAAFNCFEFVFGDGEFDAAAVEDVCAEAQAAGIKVMCWDDPMTNTDGNWILNNTDLGIAIGELCGAFINEHYSEENPAQVTVIGYPQTTILLEREEGIMEGMENVAAGKYEVVANQAAIDANAAQTAMETILQRYPDCKVVTGIGAGAMIGADEALQIATGGDIPEDMGVFTTDVTKQQLEQLSSDNYPAKGIIGFEGSDEDTAAACAAMFAMILSDSLESQNVFRGVAPITSENVADIIAGMK